MEAKCVSYCFIPMNTMTKGTGWGGAYRGLVHYNRGKDGGMQAGM